MRAVAVIRWQREDERLRQTQHPVSHESHAGSQQRRTVQAHDHKAGMTVVHDLGGFLRRIAMSYQRFGPYLRRQRCQEVV